ncbi:MAG: pyruvate dehydrogenase complex dihydrolipoamide acetyltransferase [Bacteroidota bacterium]|nr:pyruvate dehydrogenase complex dihydrolipoamide acetyltransferase [Bacteroidota bacterium]
MAKAIKLPRMTDTMEEGVVASWLVQVGDQISPGEMLAEVETDKATMELENFEKGEILHLNVAEGETHPVGTIIAIVGTKGEDFKGILTNLDSKDEAESAPENKKEMEEAKTNTPAPVEQKKDSDERVKASPLAKKMASEKGLDLSQINGSGENGRIIKRDLEAHQQMSLKSSPAIEKIGEESYEEIRVSQMRKTIAKRLAESKFSAPHFYLTKEIEMDAAIEARKQMNQISEVKISINDLVVKACALALKKHPNVNSSWLGDVIRINHHTHIGVAVAVEDGLLVPVIKFADQMSLSAISNEVKNLAAKAKNKTLEPKEWEGNTFTISNLGMFGIDEFTAIVNPPDACILAVGGSKETVVVREGKMEIAHVMKVTLSCDHRVVDGATGAQFLNSVKGYLEQPSTMLV